MKAVITTFQRMSLHDGPGIRTTLFLKGCNFRCPWCHNPETLLQSPQLQHISSKCVSCGSCLSSCPHNALSLSDGRLMIDRQKCTVCGQCVPTCPNRALNVIGREISVEEALDVFMEDKIFYDTSGGGITVSGGEPFMQNEFVIELLKQCRNAGLHTAVETNLSLPWERFRAALPYVDLWMCDIKHAGDTYIINNISLLASSGAEIMVRTPVVPGVNDSEDEIREICRMVSGMGHKVRYELLGFHTLGFGKYDDLGMLNPMEGESDLRQQRLNELKNILNEYGL